MKNNQLTCQCGCKLPVRPGSQWRTGHYWRGRTGPEGNHWLGRPTRGEPGSNRGRTYAPGHPWAVRAGTVYIPTFMALGELILGYCLLEPPRWTVFFLDGDKTDLSGGNLVICQDRRYLHLLKGRQRVLLACGHVDWRRCRVCGEWGPPGDFRKDLMHRAGVGCRAK